MNRDAALAAERAWALRYDALGRLASTRRQLEKLLRPARNSYRAHGTVPGWCGVEMLRGWAFTIAREESTKELSDVLEALRRHPAVTPDETPPRSQAASAIALPTRFADACRMHRDPAFLAAKQARWFEPHVAPLNTLVDEIRAVSGLDVPYLDPDSGGVRARVLFLLQAPARAAAHDSHMLSPDNNDGTAANVWRAYQEARMPRTYGIHWNAVPWYIGTTQKLGRIEPAHIDAGLAWTARLLDLTPEVRVLVAFGVDAKRASRLLSDELERRGITTLTSIHPSPRNYNSRRERTHREVRAAFVEAKRLAD